MINPQQQPSPCPECKGTRVVVGYGHELFLGYRTGGRVYTYPFRAVCCTQCGHMTQYADPQFVMAAYSATVEQQQKEASKNAQMEALRQRMQDKKK